MSTTITGNSSKRVRITPRGSCYHADDCAFIRRYNARQQGAHDTVSLAEAKKLGLDECYLCKPKPSRR